MHFEPTFQAHITSNLLAHLGMFLPILFLCASVFACYAYAPQLTRTFPPSTIDGVLRVMAFIVLCIGAQIALNSYTALLADH